MYDQEKRINIARFVCSRFVHANVTTKEHQLLVEFKDPNLLSDMQNRSQLKLNTTNNEFMPCVAAFALLPDGEELNQQTKEAFLRTVPLLLQLFCDKGEGGCYTVDELLQIANELEQDADGDKDVFRMGLYACSEFGLLSPMAWSRDGLEVATFGVAKQVVMMEDPLPWWEQRVQSARAETLAQIVGFPNYSGMVEEDFDESFHASFSTSGFWELVHPGIRAEVSRRFAIHEYADAVMAALQVVAHSVRDKTGIREDGARLMATAFGVGISPILFLKIQCLSRSNQCSPDTNSCLAVP